MIDERVIIMSLKFIPSHTLLDIGELKLMATLANFDMKMFDYSTFIDVKSKVTLTLMHKKTKDKFHINQISHFSIVRSLQIAVEWFYDNAKKDMFVINEKGQLVFNNDYNELIVTMSSTENEHIEIRPIVNDTVLERGKEGVIIFINRSESYIILDRQEFEALYFTLLNFSFQTELAFLLDVDMIAVKLKGE